MAHETESTILDIDADAIKKKLVALGAEKTRDTILCVSWFRIKGVKEGEDPWYLRVRSDAEGGHEVTWKGKSDILGASRTHKEINFVVSDPEKMGGIFEAIGLENYAYQEKKRTSFTFKNWQFDIDHYPGMPPYLEIEGSSENHVQEAIRLLGLEGNRTWAKGERLLIQTVYDLDWYKMRF